ncbi:hypothetical protein PF008_g32969, partial [Phytophthora fragariae]
MWFTALWRLYDAVSTWAGFPTIDSKGSHSKFSRTASTPAKTGTAPQNSHRQAFHIHSTNKGRRLRRCAALSR